jgi:hypothetical protein
VWTDSKKKQHSEWNKSYWSEERKASHPKEHSIDSVSVTDLKGNSKRIPKYIYESIDKTRPINAWEYVSVSSKESKRRKLTKSPLGP